MSVGFDWSTPASFQKKREDDGLDLDFSMGGDDDEEETDEKPVDTMSRASDDEGKIFIVTSTCQMIYHLL